MVNILYQRNSLVFGKMSNSDAYLKCFEQQTNNSTQLYFSSIIAYLSFTQYSAFFFFFFALKTNKTKQNSKNLQREQSRAEWCINCGSPLASLLHIVLSILTRRPLCVRCGCKVETKHEFTESQRDAHLPPPCFCILLVLWFAEGMPVPSVDLSWGLFVFFLFLLCCSQTFSPALKWSVGVDVRQTDR